MPVALFLDTAVALFKRYRWLIAVVPLALALAWQSWQAHRWHKAADKARAAIVALQAASDANKAAAIAQVKAVEAKSAQIAKEADHAHETTLADARAATARYAAAHRVRADQVCSGPTAIAAERDNPGERPEMPADPSMVAVSETDLQALVDWLAYGVAEHNRSVDKIKAGLAVPEVGF